MGERDVGADIGTTSSGGDSASQLGGVTSAGGVTNGGGASNAGGTSAATGGTSSSVTGGTTPTGGTIASGGTQATGGTTSTGGSAGSGCTGSFETIQSSTGLCVAKMVMIAAPTGYSDYSIDVTEVTKGQYDAWLAKDPSLPASTDTNCGWKSTGSYAEQGTGFTGTDAEHHPVVYVDWCDAYAYCKGVGKRLCGAIGGGSVDYASGSVDASKSQWYRACTSGGAYPYPYGKTYQPSTCDGPNYTAGATVAVGSLDQCVTSATGYAGVYDLSGNAWEWEDNCNGNGQSGYCRARGGSFYLGSGDTSCSFCSGGYRSDAHDSFGFRCCSL